MPTFPKRFQSYNGTEFKNKILTKLLNYLLIKEVYGIPFKIPTQ